MRRAVFTLCTLICITLSGRTREEIRASIFTDISSKAGSHNLCFGFSHNLSTHWSVEGRCSFLVPGLVWSEEEREHYGSLGKEVRNSGKEVRDSAKALLSGGGGSPELQAGFTYWPERFYDGWYIGTACSHTIRGDTDIIMSCGYAARIWKGLGFSAGYEVRLFERMKAGTLGPEGIKIGIYYAF